MGYDAVCKRKAEARTFSNLPTTSAYVYDDNDRLTAITGAKATTYDYDLAGNVIRLSTDIEF